MHLKEQNVNIFKNCINGKNIFIAFTKKNKSAKLKKVPNDAEEMKESAENEITEKIFVKIHSPTHLKFGDETFTNEQIRKKFDILFEVKHKIFFANESDENKFVIDFEKKSVEINGQRTENVTEKQIMNNTTPIIDMFTMDDSASEYDTSSTSFRSKELTKNASKATTSSVDDGPETPSTIRQILANDALASQSSSPVKKVRKALKKMNIFRKKQKDKV
ncbi:hypothetical protein niasHT_029453 [Heterodera trifolii]|uniref:Uncharacterized protein n=1 Tax=Heterodera trifolii TaxID=157864 RepID=A0ABD2KQS9_9BILA